jgi:ribose transport system substrate-binding protein
MSLHNGVRISLRCCGALATLIAATVLVAGCGSSSGSGGGSSSTSGDAATSAQSSSSGSASANAPNGADPNKVYAPGVPTLAELYKSTEGEPPTSGPPVAKNKTVIFVSCGQASPGCAGPPNEMAKAAKIMGWRYSIVDGALDANNGWATAMRQAIAEKPDAIVVHGINCQDTKAAFLEAKAQGIGVLGIESADCSDPDNPGGPSAPLFTIGNFQFSSSAPNAGAFFQQWGELQAAYIIDATEGHAKVIRTVFTSAFGRHQQQGQDLMLAKCSGCKVLDNVSWVSADSVPGGPLTQKFTTALIQNPSANAAILNFDSTATSAGLGKVIVDEGRSNNMISVAGEGYAAALQLIRDGQGLTADPAHSGKWEAWAAADELNRYFNHKPLVPEGVGFRMIDKGHNMMPAGQDYTPPINYQSIYLKSWGVK